MADNDLAVDGGPAVRERTLPYGRQTIEQEDIDAVVEVLRSDWLTTGPMVGRFEADFAAFAGVDHAVAVSNGTAALHAMMFAVDVGPGDEVIVPAMTFAATANAAVYQGATPVFADVDSDTLLLDPASVAERVTSRTRAVIAVDYAGQPCDYPALGEICDKHSLRLLADACHSPGASLHGRPVGSLAEMSAFSLHPVKSLTSGEGGVVTTDDTALTRRLRLFRNHGITSDHREREEAGSWQYDMVELGYNYRLTDFQCALAKTQLARLPEWIDRRRQIAALYDDAFADLPGVRPLGRTPGSMHAYHLYVVRFERDRFTADRAAIFRALRAEGIGVNVHYIPVHLHPFYRRRFGTGPGLCPGAEAAYEEIVTLPVFPRMSDGDAEDVTRAVRKVVDRYGR